MPWRPTGLTRSAWPLARWIPRSRQSISSISSRGDLRPLCWENSWELGPVSFRPTSRPIGHRLAAESEVPDGHRPVQLAARRRQPFAAEQRHVLRGRNDQCKVAAYAIPWSPSQYAAGQPQNWDMKLVGVTRFRQPMGAAPAPLPPLRAFAAESSRPNMQLTINGQSRQVVEGQRLPSCCASCGSTANPWRSRSISNWCPSSVMPNIAWPKETGWKS